MSWVVSPLLNRRRFGQFAAGSLASLVGLPRAQAAPDAATWTNWSGLQRCTPRQLARPADEAALAALLRATPAPLRMAGAGHSFTALVPTDHTLVSMEALQGLVRHDPVARTAVVRAGTRLAVLAPTLDALGLALPNQPDISVQSLGGSYATATHGTGATLPALHAQIRAMRLITPQGDLLALSRERDRALFDAARVSLGALGVVSEVELQLRERFHLRRRVWTQPAAALIADADALARRHRHFELFLLPHTGYGAGVVHDEVPPGPAQRLPSTDEDTLLDLRRLRDWLQHAPALRRWVAQRFIAEREEIEHDLSWQLLSTARAARFNESEYHLPVERGTACLAEVLATLERRSDTYYPIEFRYVAADDAWLSPFHGRASCSIAVHAAADEPHDYLLSLLGPVFRRHGGRPHWGKLHDQSAAELAALYPRWDDFRRLRGELDPRGRLLNPYLARLLGEVTHG